ncbi:unnamed protein product [Meganyctiphanes norvegica]|uniref:Uncharacterized protein n=1 Tax=Meganyctiphanes norvegica TaxID=48144 RepID=A0AAV2PVA9_MEGNR
MKVSKVTVGAGALLLLAALATVLLQADAYVTEGPSPQYITSFPDEPDIDGILITVGIAVGRWFAGALPYPGLSAIINAIINAWEPKPEDDYWSHVHTQVEELCGTFINEHNIQQVEIYKNDLMSLLKQYERSQVDPDGSYPDKNTIADALSTSIITNRYLIEAAELPVSMGLHFMDISSVHIMVLKDAAESYTSEAGVSRWWVDLANELDHYSTYGRWLQGETIRWRDTNIECYFDEADQSCLDFEWTGIDCYDEYTIRDHVSNYEEDCDQVHPDSPEDGSCHRFCDLYQMEVNRGYCWLAEP